MKIKDLAEKVMADHVAVYCSKRTAKNYKDAMTYILNYMPDKSAALSTADLDGFVAYLKSLTTYKGTPLNPSSINFILSVLSVMLKKAYRWGIIKSVPEIPRMRHKTSNDLGGNFLSADELKRAMPLFQEEPEPYKTAFYLATFAGLRIGEIETLCFSDIDRERKTITVREGKGGKRRTVPLSDMIEQVVTKGSGLVMSPLFKQKKANERLAAICEKIGRKEKITFHGLRHTFATIVLGRGASIPTLQALLGHSNMATTMVYLHAAPEDSRRAVESIVEVFTS